MLKNILKFCVAFGIITTVIGSYKPQITTSVLEGFHDDLNTDPYTRIGNKLYHFGQTKVTWFKASLICRSMGGFLASFNSKEELTQLSNFLIAHYPTDRWWWLSGSDLDTEGDFFWYGTGDRVTYSDWSKGQPDNAGGHENCVHLWFQRKKYQMNDWNCKNPAFFICEADKPKTVVLSVF